MSPCSETDLRSRSLSCWPRIWPKMPHIQPADWAGAHPLSLALGMHHPWVQNLVLRCQHTALQQEGHRGAAGWPRAPRGGCVMSTRSMILCGSSQQALCKPPCHGLMAQGVSVGSTPKTPSTSFTQAHSKTGSLLPFSRQMTSPKMLLVFWLLFPTHWNSLTCWLGCRTHEFSLSRIQLGALGELEILHREIKVKSPAPGVRAVFHAPVLSFRENGLT